MQLPLRHLPGRGARPPSREQYIALLRSVSHRASQVAAWMHTTTTPARVHSEEHGVYDVGKNADDPAAQPGGTAEHPVTTRDKSTPRRQCTSHVHFLDINDCRSVIVSARRREAAALHRSHPDQHRSTSARFSVSRTACSVARMDFNPC